MSCEHEMKEYHGFVDFYPYCTKCGLKESEIKASIQNEINCLKKDILKQQEEIGKPSLVSLTPTAKEIIQGQLPVLSDDRISEQLRIAKSIYANANFPFSSPFLDMCQDDNSLMINNALYLHVKYPTPVGRSASIGYSSASVPPFAFVVPKSNASLTFAPLAWIPAYLHNPLFCGVDRSVDPIRLAGVRGIPGPGIKMEDKLSNLQSQLFREGGNPTDAFLHPDDFQTLKAQQGAQHTALFFGPYGIFKLHQEAACPKGYAWLLQRDTWWKHPKVGVFCNAPGFNGVIQLC